jgi:hypothetical protein
MHRLTIALGSACVTLSCTSAQPLVMPVPRYPDMLRAVAATGDVPVRVTLSRTGAVSAIQVDTQFTTLPGARDLFVFAVQRALRDARFAPARHFGAAVTGTADFVYRFALTRPVTPMRADEVAGKADSLPPGCPSSPSWSIIVVCVPAHASRARVVY